MFNPTQVQERIDALRAAIKTERDPQVMSHHLAELQVALSERAEIAADRMDRQTMWLIRLTWALALLTVFIAILTVPLAYDAYLKIKTHKQQGQVSH